MKELGQRWINRQGYIRNILITLNMQLIQGSGGKQLIMGGAPIHLYLIN